ncbi:hypothetical protein [Amycolatopsis sp. WQ 127309]|uniref:WXG100-like domain-containing protein n=1 Tax=Amycolatopsis sp. WQ 127309 TaxID=2932773 RepID=UPI001FF5FB47|nr:hypothetical protein [Amycolatopsis sp. WQ 127309]UOZ03260.1 hypothetical protein MUY22_30920 [Amycolatopsis sp. WQ 127309]
MSLMVDPSLNWIFYIIAGDAWPQGDEDKLRELAAEWDQVARDIAAAGQGFNQLSQHVTANVGGDVQQNFSDFSRNLSTLGADYVQRARAQAASLREQALNVENAKYGMLISIAVTAAEVLWALTNPFTAPLVPEIMAAGRTAVVTVQRTLVQRLTSLLARIAREAAQEAAEEVAEDMLAQFIQIAQGNRNGFDWKSIGQSAALGAVGGAFAHVAGNGLGKVDGKFGTKFSKNVWGEAGNEAATEVVVGLTGAAAFGGDLDSLGWGALNGGLSGAATHGAHHAGESLHDKLTGGGPGAEGAGPKDVGDVGFDKGNIGPIDAPPAPGSGSGGSGSGSGGPGSGGPGSGGTGGPGSGGAGSGTGGPALGGAGSGTGGSGSGGSGNSPGAVGVGGPAPGGTGTGTGGSGSGAPGTGGAGTGSAGMGASPSSGTGSGPGADTGSGAPGSSGAGAGAGGIGSGAGQLGSSDAGSGQLGTAGAGSGQPGSTGAGSDQSSASGAGANPGQAGSGGIGSGPGASGSAGVGQGAGGSDSGVGTSGSGVGTGTDSTGTGAETGGSGPSGGVGSSGSGTSPGGPGSTGVVGSGTGVPSAPGGSGPGTEGAVEQGATAPSPGPAPAASQGTGTGSVGQGPGTTGTGSTSQATGAGQNTGTSTNGSVNPVTGNPSGLGPNGSSAVTPVEAPGSTGGSGSQDQNGTSSTAPQTATDPGATGPGTSAGTGATGNSGITASGTGLGTNSAGPSSPATGNSGITAPGSGPDANSAGATPATTGNSGITASGPGANSAGTNPPATGNSSISAPGSGPDANSAGTTPATTGNSGITASGTGPGANSAGTNLPATGSYGAPGSGLGTSGTGTNLSATDNSRFGAPGTSGTGTTMSANGNSNFSAPGTGSTGTNSSATGSPGSNASSTTSNPPGAGTPRTGVNNTAGGNPAPGPSHGRPTTTESGLPGLTPPDAHSSTPAPPSVAGSIGGVAAAGSPTPGLTSSLQQPNTGPATDGVSAANAHPTPDVGAAEVGPGSGTAQTSSEPATGTGPAQSSPNPSTGPGPVKADAHPTAAAGPVKPESTTGSGPVEGDVRPVSGNGPAKVDSGSITGSGPVEGDARPVTGNGPANAGPAATGSAKTGVDPASAMGSVKPVPEPVVGAEPGGAVTGTAKDGPRPALGVGSAKAGFETGPTKGGLRSVTGTGPSDVGPGASKSGAGTAQPRPVVPPSAIKTDSVPRFVTSEAGAATKDGAKNPVISANGDPGAENAVNLPAPTGHQSPSHAPPKVHVGQSTSETKKTTDTRRRDSAPPARLVSERFDPAKSISQQFEGDGLKDGELDGTITQIRYDVRRYETEDGGWVQDFTVPLDLTSNSGSVTPEARAQLAKDLQKHLDATVNQGNRLPGGDQLHVTVDVRTPQGPVDGDWQSDRGRGVPVDVHDSTVDGARPTDQTHWDVHDAKTGLTHEVMHYLGLGEGYHDDRLLFHRDDQPGVMGPDAWADSTLTEQNLAKIQEISDTATIHDHHLGDPGVTFTPRSEPPSGQAKSPSNHHSPARAPITVNTVTVDDPHSGQVLDRRVLPPPQHTVLGVHGMDPVLVGGDTPHDNFREAVAASLSDNAPNEHARITAALDGNKNETNLDTLAEAADVHVHVLDSRGNWTSHGPETGRPVHIIQTTVDGKPAYLGTKENVHIGRPHVSYPGSTVLRTEEGRKVVHRGEFEIETVKGQHHVRLYTAILTPAARGSEFKDVHQDADGHVHPFSGDGKEGSKVFWVGGGRPLRALQWTAKYEHDVNRKPGMQPVLRSFLVPLDTFTKVSEQATVEAHSQGNSLSMNVDQNGDTNQFGLRGKDFDALQQQALKGSLVTYTPGGHDRQMPDVAGRQEDLADLYHRLGISPDFDSAALGRENDPWFSWTPDGRKYFRNDPAALRGLARTLGNHYHTWKNSPDLFFTPAGDSIPDVTGHASPDSKARRTEDMNVFLNTHGPGRATVGQLSDGIGAAIDTAVRQHAPDGVPVGSKELKDAVLGEVKDSLKLPNQVLAEAMGDARRDTLDNIRAAMTTDPQVAAKAADVVTKAVTDRLTSELGDTGTFGPDVAKIVHQTVREHFDALKGTRGTQLDGLKQGKRGYLSGPRAEAFTKGIADDLGKNAGLKKLLAKPGVTIAPDVFAAQLKAQVVPKAMHPVTKTSLVGLDADALRAHFQAKQNDVADALAKELGRKNAGKLADPGFRKNLANAVGPEVRDPDLLHNARFDPVTHEDADAFMDRLPDFATQAEIGSAIATDERRIKADFDTRETDLTDDGIDGTPFANEFGRWQAEHTRGYTQKNDPAVFARHQTAGHALASTIEDALADPKPESAKKIVDQLVSDVDSGGTLARKFAETVKPQADGRPDRAPGQTKPNTFGEHAQMVLNQYLTLTQGQPDAGRFVSRDAIAKAILFHDADKVNSKNQYGDAQVSHDREPEHRGAVQHMNRHEGLWASKRDFEIARAFVDSDPFGFYFRDMGVSATDVHTFVKALAHRAKTPDGRTPNASDVRDLFREFHQYYQADFSSYSPQAKFVNDTTGEVQDGYDKLTGLAVEGGDHVRVPGEHRFAYSNDPRDGGKTPYEQKYQELAKLFDDAVHDGTVLVGDTDPGPDGTDRDPARGVRAVHDTNPQAKPTVLARVKPREFSENETRAIDDALKHYAPILGERRAHSSRAHAEQEVRHFAAVSFGVERGQIAPTARAEYLASHGTVNLYAMGVINREFGGGHRGIEGTVTHELAHGLLSYALDDYSKHVGSWNADGSPHREPGGEPPADPKIRDDVADFKAALKSHLLDPSGFATRSPRRSEFVNGLTEAHPDVFTRLENELSGKAAERIFKAVKGSQAEFNVHTGHWDADGYPAFAGERPISKYGATNVHEDMAETAKYYFMDPDHLRQHAPQRAEFFDRLIAGWDPAHRDDVLVDDAPDTRPLRARLPEYARDGRALGALAPVDVRGADEVGTRIEQLLSPLADGRPEGVDAITGSLKGGGFESFLGAGKASMVRVGEKWFEVRVQAEPDLASVAADQITDATPAAGDVTNKHETTHGDPNADTTTGSVGTSVFWLFPAGPYASVGASAQLASPAVEHTSTSTGTEQRVIRSAGDLRNADVPVKYRITVTTQTGGQTGSEVDGSVRLLVPTDLAGLETHETKDATPRDDWAERVEFLAPEAVLLDEQAFFDQVSGKLHPSVTKFGAPGRSALREFVSGGGLRQVLGTALSGSPVVSNDLASPHGSYREAVELRAKPTGVELLGTVPGDSEVKLTDSAVAGGSTSAASKSGGDVNGIFGGGAYIPGAVGGVAGVSASASAKVTQTSQSGTSVTTKTNLNAKGDIGLYKVTVDLAVTTSSGETITVPATAYVRMGLPEAKAQGLPVPDGTRDKVTPGEKRFEPPYLAAAAAAGHVRAGTFTPATKVQAQIENTLRERPGFAKFLPRFDKLQRDVSKGSGADTAERLGNLRKITATFSPAALRSKMDDLLGPGVSTQLKRRGLFTDEYLSVTVKAKLSPGRHLGQATGRSVKGSTATSPTLSSSTTTEKGWSVGLEGRMMIPKTTPLTSLGISPTVTPVQYSDTTTWKNSGGPTTTTTTGIGGSPDAQVFEHDVEFEVEITSHTRHRPWVKKLTPGSPFRQTPRVSIVAKTGDGLPKIAGQVDLWVSDGSAPKTDPTRFAPGKPTAVDLETAPKLDALLGADRPPAPKFLHVEAVANTEALRDEAVRQLGRAAGGDGVLGLPGGEARKRIDRMFSPQTFRSGLPRFLRQGARSGGFRYERRVADRVGGLGMNVELSNPKLVMTSEAGGSDTTFAGGTKAGYEKSRKQAVEANAQFGMTIRADGSDPHGQGQLYTSAKWSPWSRTKGTSAELSASVDHVRRAPSDSRTVLVQYDADVRLVAETRQESVVNGGKSRAGADVKLPGAVFVRMTEDQAREQGLLPSVEPRTPAPGTLTAPALVGGTSSALGAAVVEDAPDLSGLIRDARATLGKTGDRLLPKSVLDDSMNNLQRMLDAASPESVTSLVDGALDGGVPLVLHDPGVVTTDTYQVLLKARVTETEFLDVAHDGSEIDHAVSATATAKENAGHGSSYGGQFRGAGRGLFTDSHAKVSGYDGVYKGVSGTRTKTDQTTATGTKTTSKTASSSGPAVRYRAKVTFDLVVTRGDRTFPVTSQDTDLVVRAAADDQKITTGAAPKDHNAAATNVKTFTDADLKTWQDGGHGALPASATTEGLRGAAEVRAAARQALRTAGARDGLIGNTTLASAVTNEMLQANLPDLVKGPLDVPELHEAAVLRNGHGTVKVYARVVNPKLAGLSDSVKLEHSATETATFTGEAKASSSSEQQHNLGGGGVTDPGQNAHSWGGLDTRSPDASTDPTSSTSAGDRSVTGKPKGRTGLVGFDVEYRVVADLGGGRTAAVEVKVPSSALVRMTDADVEAFLKAKLPDTLSRAQDAVKDAAEAWRTAEQAVAQAQRGADDRWLDQREGARRLTEDGPALGVDTSTDVIQALRDALAAAETDARDAGARLRAGNAEISRLNDVADQALTLAGAAEPGSDEQRGFLATHGKALEDAAAIRAAQPELTRTRGAAQDRAERLAAVLDDHRNDRADQISRRDAALDEVVEARRQADEARQAWWDAKRELDRQVDAFDPSTVDAVLAQDTVTGVDTGTGLPYDFDVSQIEARPVTDRSGRVVAVSFLPAAEHTADIERDWADDHSDTVGSLPEGATPERTAPLLRDARENGAKPDLDGRAFGEWASQSPAPWDPGTLFVMAHGRPQSVKLTLLGGRTVRVDGASFAKILAASKPFAQAAGSARPSITLIACATGKLDGPGGVAHDFQRALTELGGPLQVHAPTEPALFGRPSATLGQATGATRGFTTVTDGGHFATFGERFRGELADQPGTTVEFDAPTATLLRDASGEVRGVSFLEPDEAAKVQAWLSQTTGENLIVEAAPDEMREFASGAQPSLRGRGPGQGGVLVRAPWADELARGKTFLVTGHGEETRAKVFAEVDGERRAVFVDGATLARLVTSSFGSARPESVTLFPCAAGRRPGPGGVAFDFHAASGLPVHAATDSVLANRRDGDEPSAPLFGATDDAFTAVVRGGHWTTFGKPVDTGAVVEELAEALGKDWQYARPEPASGLVPLADRARTLEVVREAVATTLALRDPASVLAQHEQPDVVRAVVDRHLGHRDTGLAAGARELARAVLVADTGDGPLPAISVTGTGAGSVAKALAGHLGEALAHDVLARVPVKIRGGDGGHVEISFASTRLRIDPAVGEIVGRLRSGLPVLRLDSVADAVESHENPGLLWTSVLAQVATSPEFAAVTHVVDRRFDPASGKWRPVGPSIPDFFPGVGKGEWRDGLVYRPLVPGASVVDTPRSIAESIVERLGDGLPAPVVPDELMADVQSELIAVTPPGAAPFVIDGALSPADAAAVAGLAEEFALLQLHGVTDTVVGRDDVLEIAARVAGGLDVGAAADAIDALVRHGALRPGLVTVAMDAVLASPDVETRAGAVAAVVRELAEGDLPIGVMREAVRGAVDDPEPTRRALWLMRRFRVTNLAWLYRWRIAEGVRRYQEQEKAASERSARLTAAVGGVRDDG